MISRVLLPVLVPVLFLVACKRDVTEEVESLESRACACAANKDAACGKAVLADLAKLREARNVKADEARAAASAKKLAACMLESGVTALEIHQAINLANEPTAESN